MPRVLTRISMNEWLSKPPSKRRAYLNKLKRQEVPETHNWFCQVCDACPTDPDEWCPHEGTCKRCSIIKSQNTTDQGRHYPMVDVRRHCKWLFYVYDYMIFDRIVDRCDVSGKITVCRLYENGDVVSKDSYDKDSRPLPDTVGTNMCKMRFEKLCAEMYPYLGDRGKKQRDKVHRLAFDWWQKSVIWRFKSEWHELVLSDASLRKRPYQIAEKHDARRCLSILGTLRLMQLAETHFPNRRTIKNWTQGYPMPRSADFDINDLSQSHLLFTEIK